MRNRVSIWNLLLPILLTVIALFYAAPNFFGDIPTVEISPIQSGASLSENQIGDLQAELKRLKIPWNSTKIMAKKRGLIIQFPSVEKQLASEEILRERLNDRYLLALNLRPKAPSWFSSFGSKPMKLGLDLRGGSYMQLKLDFPGLFANHIKDSRNDVARFLYQKKVEYKGVTTDVDKILVNTLTHEEAKMISSLLAKKFPNFKWEIQKGSAKEISISGSLTAKARQQMKQNAITQALEVMRHRINGLGVSEAIVQQQGADSIAISLPGVQDSTRARAILGKTATIGFHLLDGSSQGENSLRLGVIPYGDVLYHFKNKPVLLRDDVILTGSQITKAYASYDQMTNQPIVIISIGGKGVDLFETKTAENVGAPLATTFTEMVSESYIGIKTSKSKDKNQSSEILRYRKQSRIINIATIQSALRDTFTITGLSGSREAQDLALLLRSGSLPTAVTIVSEKTVGPSMGQKNIRQGLTALGIGLILVMILLGAYYRTAGLIANVTFCINFILLLAALSILNATLTFPGIAGMVLTLCMAVDANILVFERMREELRAGFLGIKAWRLAFDRASITIFDSNATALIVALLLFLIGSGPVRGFAVTFTIGILTSLISVLWIGRIIALLLCQFRRGKISVGIKNLWLSGEQDGNS